MIHNVKPTVHAPAREAVVTVGPPRRRAAVALSIVELERVRVLAVDFYPGRPPKDSKPLEPQCR